MCGRMFCNLTVLQLKDILGGEIKTDLEDETQIKNYNIAPGN